MATATTHEHIERGLKVTWAGLLSTENGDAFHTQGNTDISIQAFGTFGTSTVNVQGSNDDGTTWANLNDTSGSAIALTGAGFAQILEIPILIRAVAAGGAGATLTVTMTMRR